jgi:hypothetical protein
MRFMSRRCRVACVTAAVLLGSALAPACREVPDPIQVDGGQLVVQNQTAQEWSSIEIWVNNHYRVQYPRLRAGQRLIVPFDTFVSGWGQRFDRRKQYAQGIELTAKSSDGRDVRLVWGKGRIR